MDLVFDHQHAIEPIEQVRQGGRLDQEVTGVALNAGNRFGGCQTDGLGDHRDFILHCWTGLYHITGLTQHGRAAPVLEDKIVWCKVDGHEESSMGRERCAEISFTRKSQK